MAMDGSSHRIQWDSSQIRLTLIQVVLLRIQKLSLVLMEAM